MESAARLLPVGSSSGTSGVCGRRIRKDYLLLPLRIGAKVCAELIRSLAQNIVFIRLMCDRIAPVPRLRKTILVLYNIEPIRKSLMKTIVILDLKIDLLQGPHAPLIERMCFHSRRWIQKRHRAHWRSVHLAGQHPPTPSQFPLSFCRFGAIS